MTGFSETQKAFAGAVLDAEAATPASLTRKADGVPARRFGVYRNNVYAGLIDVLAGRFPVVARLVGEEFFRAMAATMSSASRRAPRFSCATARALQTSSRAFLKRRRCPISPTWQRSNG